MPKVFQVITGNWLHTSKKIFKSLGECKAHIDKILRLRDPRVSVDNAQCSVWVTEIDTKELPEYAKIFKIQSKITPPTERYPENGPEMPSVQLIDDEEEKPRARANKSTGEAVMKPI